MTLLIPERALAPHEPRPSADAWQSRYRHVLFLTDATVITASTLTAMYVRFGLADDSVSSLARNLLSLGLVVCWLGALIGTRAYEGRYLGTGADEFKRVSSASLRLMAVVAVLCYTLRLSLARGYVAIALPLGTCLLLLSRYALRRWVHARRRRGGWLHRVVAVGGAAGVEQLATEFARGPYAGFTLVGACVTDPEELVGLDGVPVLGGCGDVIDAVRATGADTVAVAAGLGMSSAMLRALSWQLEGTGVDLVVSPALTDVAGPRISIRPVAGLPLLHVEKPEIAGFRQGFKTGCECVLAAIVLVLLLPLLVVLAIAIRIDSPGAPLFRQTRVGRKGKPFTVFKLRTMRTDAESLLAELAEQNESRDGLLFKIRRDPRVTRLGALLRKWSLDELPQLWNVVRGDMALVGPRPPLPSEVAAYQSDVARRLLVRPGITGLWQVSGRSNLSWDDSVRLDLYYVENWSLALDLMIIWKTVFAVLRRNGAY
jgi:exopolysaccharide biosynthesis polyprenyl glycosylphosphotransferase